FSYKNWLFFTNFSLWRNEKALVLLTMVDLAGIACCAFIITRVNSNKATRQLNAFWFAVAGVAILMMTQLSTPIWVVISVLRRIQFPWRFNAIASLATTALVALALSSLKKSMSTSLKISTTVALLLIISWIPATSWAIWQAYPFHTPDPADFNYKMKEI